MNLEQDIFDMDDDSFMAQYGSSDSLVQTTEESVSEEDMDSTFESDESFEEEPTEEEDYEVNEDTSLDEEVSSDDDDQADIESSSEEESDDVSEQEESSINFENEYNKLIGVPIKGAGKEITLANADEAIKLIQMGMGYHKSMEQMKPAKRIIAMLENNDMMDEDKLSYAIDLINKNPKAISKLVSESEFDSYEVDEEETKSYKPTDYSVSSETIALDNALKDISDTPSYAKTVQVIARQWDAGSRDIIKRNPNTIAIINDHIATGLFDTVSNEVERQRMLGNIPSGLSDLEVYKLVGDNLYAQSQASSAPQAHVGQQQQFEEQANVTTPIKKPTRETVVKSKRATSVPRSSNNRQRLTAEDIFDMDDNAFLSKYGSGNNFYR